MTTDPGTERRLSRLENDTEAIYELIADFRSDFDDFRDEFSVLKSDVTTLKSDVTTLKTDVTTLKTDVTVLKTEFGDFKAETRGRFDRIEETLVEVVRRLPEPS